MNPSSTSMRAEALAAADCVREFLRAGLPAALAAGRGLADARVRHIELLGRGSSSHAGTVLRYAIAGTGHYRVSAAMPFIAAQGFDAAVWEGTAVLAISQSGRSPDLVRYAQAARDAGARVVALVNMPGSPLAATAHAEVPLHAGAEQAVAATKTVVASVVAGLAVLAGATGDAALLRALQALPARLDAAARADWGALGAALVSARGTARAVYVVGRGVDLGVAKELALKMAETTGIPALAFSSAEFLHGPLGAVSAQTPVLGLAGSAADVESVREALRRAAGRGAPTLIAHGLPSPEPAADLPLPAPEGTVCDAVLALLPAYLAIEAAARAAGRDPDRPGGLAKVTETL